MKIVVIGATGMIGRAVCSAMSDAGHEVTALVRDVVRAQKLLPGRVNRVIFGDEDDGAWKTAVAGADVIINLAGEPIGGARWSPKVKERLVKSRVDTTRRIVDAMLEAARSGGKPAALINASAVGYYGDCGEEIVTEEHGPGSDFLAQLCVRWEEEAQKALGCGARIVLMRLGLVLAQSGVLQEILYPLPVHVSPFKLGLGGPIGNGKQWMPWIHIDDVVGLFILAATNPKVEGAINVTAPDPVTNSEFTRTLGRVLHRPAVLPIPAFALRAVVGEFAGALLSGQCAIPAAAQRLGYSYGYSNLDKALRDLI